MKIMKVLLIVLAAVVGGLVMVTCSVMSGYDRAIALDEQVNSSWAQVENQLQRRFDLIPNLVETVKGVSEHEKDVFLGIAKARESYFQAKTTGGKVKAAGMFESALSRLLVLRESYPELRANESFLRLQDSVEGTENRLSTERRRYNESVKQLNEYTRKLWGRLCSTLANVEPGEYFEVADETKAVPKVKFTDDG